MNSKKEMLAYVACVFAGLLLLVFFLFLNFSKPPVSFLDFQVYLQSYEDFHAGRNMYARFLSTFPQKDPTGKYFAYLPPFVFIGGLFSRVSPPYNLFLFQGLSLLCFYASMFLLFRFFTHARHVPEQFLFSSMLLYAFPFQYTFALGQINAFLLFFVTLFFVALKQNKMKLASFALVPAAAAKFFPFLLCLSVLKLSKSAFIVFVFLCLCFGVVSLFMFPVATRVFFGEMVARRFIPVDNAANPSLSLFLRKCHLPAFSAYPVLAAALAFAWRKLDALSLAFFLLPFSFLFAPLSWIHHYVLLFPSYFYLLGQTTAKKSVVYLSLLLVMIPPLKSAFFPLSFFPLYGLLILIACVFLKGRETNTMV